MFEAEGDSGLGGSTVLA